jgi:hypothetical protein
VGAPLPLQAVARLTGLPIKFGLQPIVSKAWEA